MSRLIDNKLNYLLSHWPNGMVHTTRWLNKHGYYKQLVKKYADSGWLKKMGHGAYIKVGDRMQWPGAICALQQEFKMPMHIGGVTALELHGLAQNVVLREKGGLLYLFNTTSKKRPLPKWFQDAFPHHIYTQQYFFRQEIGLEQKQLNHMQITISSPERAILEVLVLVPHAFDYGHAYDLVENLRLVRPDEMRQLLLKCLSMKVKRLFLYLANKHQLPCASHLNAKRFDLGKGKYVIGRGGLFIPEYQISVPNLDRESEAGLGHV